MNGPVLFRYATILQKRLAGRALRYVLQKRGAGERPPVYLLRMEPPVGTLVLSLRRGAPMAVLLPEGRSPEGEKSGSAARIESVLAGMSIVEIATPGVERSLTLRWDGGIEMRVDLIPARPALYLAEKGRLSLAVTSAGVETGGALPALPASERADLLEFDPDRLPAETGSEEELRAFLRRSVRSLPPEWTEEALRRAGAGEKVDRERVAAAWKEMVAELGREGPAVLYPGEKAFLAPFPFRSLGEGAAFDDLAEGMIAFWTDVEGREERAALLRDVLPAVTKERKRLHRLGEKLRKEMEKAERFPEFRKKGEILSIHFGRIRKGAASVRLPDPYGDEELVIALDPSLSAEENRRRYFRLAKKGERGAPILRERIGETERKLTELSALHAEAESVATAEEAEAFREKARSVLPPEKKAAPWREKARKPKDRRLSIRPKEYTVTGGYTVLVGRDNKENDLLTLRVARPGDLWFHAAQASGSHVVLLRDDVKKAVPKDALLMAAAIAAFHSKAKHASKVPVIYTERRHVRKPRGSPPGLVTCTREKTLFVEPALPELGEKK